MGIVTALVVLVALMPSSASARPVERHRAIVFVLNWYLGWRRNDTDANRGLETWQGWDDGHGGGTF